jgi:crotonobetainyl-CoA:carnitine CoA-transferase CaiB-like acyl-CoA transferase
LTFETVSKRLEALNVPFGKIKGLSEVLDSKAAKDMVRAEMTEGRETLRLTGNPFSFEAF